MPSSHQLKPDPIERFPLKPRRDGRFQKRIKGHLYYFGQGGNRKGALAEYDRVKRDLYDGRRPHIVTDADTLTVKQLANLFIDEKEAQAKAGDISLGHLDDNRSAVRRFLKYVGHRIVSDLRPEDFSSFSRHLRGKCGLGGFAFNRERACVLAMFNHANKSGWLSVAVRIGGGFNKVSTAEMRTARKNRYLEPAAIRKLIDECPAQLKAMILLGINGGFGATDCSGLRWDDVDLKRGEIDTIRRKRKTQRRFPLWPETIGALEAVRTQRPDDELVFRKDDGQPFVTETEAGGPINAITKLFAERCEDLGIDIAAGVSFGALRHTFATLANGKQDRDAYRIIMGHKLSGLDEHYIEHIEPARLKRITDHVRSAVIGNQESGPSQKRRKPSRA